MIRFAAALLAFCLAAPPLAAQTSVTLGGETLVRRHESVGIRAGLLEFVPAGESLAAWTRLAGYRFVLDGPPTPLAAASAIAGAAERRYPGTRAAVFGRGDEVLVEFVLAAPGAAFVEYNAFKYAPGPGGRGVVSLQYARRVPRAELDALRAHRAAWLDEAARYDMTLVRAAFDRRTGGTAR